MLSALANNSSDDTQSHSIIAKYPLDNSLSSPMNWHCCKRFLPGFRIISQKLHQFSWLEQPSYNVITKPRHFSLPLMEFSSTYVFVHYCDSQPLILGGCRGRGGGRLLAKLLVFERVGISLDLPKNSTSRVSLSQLRASKPTS